MKKTLYVLLLPILLFSCRKSLEPSDGSADQVRSILQQKLSKADLSIVDYTTVVSAKLSNGHTLYRVAMGKENIVLDIASDGSFVKGNIYQVTGSMVSVNGHKRYSGVFHRSSLSRTDAVSYSIQNGFIKEMHSYIALATNGLQQKVNLECADCTLPEVIVSSSYSAGGIDWASWMSLLSMFDMGSPYDYLVIDWGSGGGGGGGGSYTPPPAVTIDPENPDTKAKIDPKKYTDCFGTIPDNSTTLYTVTISSDIPVDGHPEIFYDWDSYSPGHAFIELSKSTPYGSVTQDIGFYPSSAKKFVLLDNSEATSTSKIVDNGGHEYNARYTISVSAAQFQAAINQINSSSSNLYNVGLYNCTDFALGVFNAAGGNLTIPLHAIPGFEVDGGSNTPQGLYEQISQMKNNGTAGTTTTNNKEYAGSSKGPCN